MEVTGAAVSAWLGALGALLVLGTAAPPALGQSPPAPQPDEEVYRFTDEEGTVHLTQGLANVPERYRSRATPLGWVGGPLRSPAGSTPDARSRRAVDEAMDKARTTFDYLIVARRYKSRGWDEPAREAVDRAATLARDSAEWNAVAATYDALGMAQAAEAARRKARNAPPRP